MAKGMMGKEQQENLYKEHFEALDLEREIKIALEKVKKYRLRLSQLKKNG